MNQVRLCPDHLVVIITSTSLLKLLNDLRPVVVSCVKGRKLGWYCICILLYRNCLEWLYHCIIQINTHGFCTSNSLVSKTHSASDITRLRSFSNCSCISFSMDRCMNYFKLKNWVCFAHVSILPWEYLHAQKSVRWLFSFFLWICHCSILYMWKSVFKRFFSRWKEIYLWLCQLVTLRGL